MSRDPVDRSTTDSSDPLHQRKCTRVSTLRDSRCVEPDTRKTRRLRVTETDTLIGLVFDITENKNPPLNVFPYVQISLYKPYISTFPPTIRVGTEGTDRHGKK